MLSMVMHDIQYNHYNLCVTVIATGLAHNDSNIGSVLYTWYRIKCSMTHHSVEIMKNVTSIWRFFESTDCSDTKVVFKAKVCKNDASSVTSAHNKLEWHRCMPRSLRAHSLNVKQTI